MAAPKGHPKYGGRQKGTPNKLTASAKEAFQLAFQGMGGVDALTRWAKSHPNQFYALFSRLIPHEVTGADGGAIAFEKKIVHVHEPAAKPGEGV